MNFYLTSGTPEYMERMVNKYGKEGMILLHGGGNSVVMHESPKKSVFATPRRFEVIDGSGTFEQRGFFAMQNVPVMDEARPVFEERLIKAIAHLKNDASLIAYRVLRPIKADVYVVVTQWAGPASFDIWTKSGHFQGGLASLLDSSSSPTQNLFNSKTYTATYTATPAE
ncbi:MAG: antibiotic biosynthesis monooxygenase family protein [Lysinibacillus sp.]